MEQVFYKSSYAFIIIIIYQGSMKCILYSSDEDTRSNNRIDMIHQFSYINLHGQLRDDTDGNSFLFVYNFKVNVFL
jgi:hypothetical protein